jgi:hypothetical protein
MDRKRLSQMAILADQRCTLRAPISFLIYSRPLLTISATAPLAASAALTSSRPPLNCPVEVRTTPITFGILVHSSLDFNLQIPANAALFYVLCAIAASKPLQESQRRRVVRRRSLIVEHSPEIAAS